MGATRARALTFGVESFGADVIAYNVLNGLDKTGFDLRYGAERHVGRWIPWLGKHQIGVALAGLCVGLHYDILLDDGLRTLIDLPYLPGRMTPLNGLQNSIIVDDTHSATPQSMLAALEWLQTIKTQQMTREERRAVLRLYRSRPRQEWLLVFQLSDAKYKDGRTIVMVKLDIMGAVTDLLVFPRQRGVA